jgi:cytoskeletal protein RodZ
MRPPEAVSIVHAIALQVIRGELPGVPSAHVIRFTETGSIVVEGPVAADGPQVIRAAHLLETILGGLDADPHRRVSGALRIVIARALRVLDLPPYSSLTEFADALTRFAASDVSAVVRELYASWSAATKAGTIDLREQKSDAPGEMLSTVGESADGEALTVSDIRRARRATRLTLAEVSERSRIPSWLLRELEWGYFRNWPADLHGRTQLVRYARAAGLDDRLVLATVWPLVEAEAGRRGAVTVAPEDLAPADPQQAHAAAMLVPIERGPLVPTTVLSTGRHQHRLAAALAIAALLGVAFLPAAWNWWSERKPDPVIAREQPAQPERATPAAAGELDPRDTSVSKSLAPPLAARREPVPPDTVDEPAGFEALGAVTFEPDDTGVVPASHADAMTLRITRVVDDGARNYHARMSPDRTRIAFDSDRAGERAVYVADADGRNVRRVSGDGFAAMPGWSPDGHALLFVRAEKDEPEVWNFWKADLESGELQRLTSHTTGRPWGGSWFPDGSRIAYSRDAKLVVLHIETGREAVFDSPVERRPIRSPAVSPDGQHVMFQVVRDGAWLLSVPSGSVRRILEDPTADGFSWSQDSRRVAYYSGRAGAWNVWVRVGS